MMNEFIDELRAAATTLGALNCPRESKLMRRAADNLVNLADTIHAVEDFLSHRAWVVERSYADLPHTARRVSRHDTTLEILEEVVELFRQCALYTTLQLDV